MPSTFTKNSGIEKPGSGEQSGTWGQTVNTNMDIIDRSVNGVFDLGLSGTTSNLQTTDGTLSEGMYRYIRLTGSLSAAHTITVLPADAEKIYYIENATTDGGSGLQDVTIQQGAGTFVLSNGATKVVYMDGNGTVGEVAIGGGASLSDFSATDSGTGYGALTYDNNTGVFTFAKVTDANIRGAISGTGDISYDSSTGVISYVGSGGTVYNATITVSASSGLSGGGSYTTNQSFNETISLSHANTSSVSNTSNSGNTFVQNLNFDTYGHVTYVGMGTASSSLTKSALTSVMTTYTTGETGSYGWIMFNNSLNSSIPLTASSTYAASQNNMFFAGFASTNTYNDNTAARNEGTSTVSGTWRPMGKIAGGVSSRIIGGILMLRIS